jgi:hypothetical protein
MSTPPSRESGRTLVGIEPPRNGDITPPSGIDLPRDLRSMTTHQLALYAIEHGKETRDNFMRLDRERRERERARLKAEEERRKAYLQRELERDARIDGLITDVRGAVQMMREKDAALDERDGRFLELAARVGQAPQKLEMRASQVGELTAAELTELEQGTGLAGVVGRLVAGQKRLERRVGLAAALGSIAASSPSWAPAAVDLLSKVFGG